MERIKMSCPLCGEYHEVEKRKRTTTMIIKDVEVEYEETCLYCCNCKNGEGEFEVGKMTNMNLLNARNAYRKKKNLLTSDEIVEIRGRYGLSQVELAQLMGWGEATVSRYESKAIQDEAYDSMLRGIKNNPMRLLEYLKRNGEKFSESKKKEIRGRIAKELEMYGKEYLSRQSLECDYILYSEPSVFNGNTSLDINKIEGIVSYYAEQNPELYKAKLMRMLWYVDVLAYKTQGKAITGLVYLCGENGILPIGHRQILNLENVNVKELEEDEGIQYLFTKSEKLNCSGLSENELKIIIKVLEKFKDFSSKDMIRYVNEEIQYIQASAGENVSFEQAKEMRTF